MEEEKELEEAAEEEEMEEEEERLRGVADPGKGQGRREGGQVLAGSGNKPAPFPLGASALGRDRTQQASLYK